MPAASAEEYSTAIIVRMGLSLRKIGDVCLVGSTAREWPVGDGGQSYISGNGISVADEALTVEVRNATKGTRHWARHRIKAHKRQERSHLLPRKRVRISCRLMGVSQSRLLSCHQQNHKHVTTQHWLP